MDEDSTRPLLEEEEKVLAKTNDDEETKEPTIELHELIRKRSSIEQKFSFVTIEFRPLETVSWDDSV